MRKPVLPYVNNKGAGHPAHPRCLISAFVVRCLESIIPLVSISEISSFCLASVATQAGLSLSWSQTPKTGFFVTRLSCRNLGSRHGQVVIIIQPLVTVDSILAQATVKFLNIRTPEM